MIATKLFKIALTMALFILVMGTGSKVFAQSEIDAIDAIDAQRPAKLRVVLRLSDSTLKKLNESGFAKAAVSKNKKDKVVSLKLTPESTFVDELKTIKATTKVDRDVLEVELTDEIVKQLQFQPVEIPVMRSGFSKVLLKYKRGAAATDVVRDQKNQFFVVRKEDGGGIYANLSGQLDAETRFGKIAIPWEQVEAVHFGKGIASTIILKNGDKISGTVGSETVTVKTDWGDHDFTSADLFSFSRSSQHRFLRNKIEGREGIEFVYYNLSKNSIPPRR